MPYIRLIYHRQFYGPLLSDVTVAGIAKMFELQRVCLRNVTSNEALLEPDALVPSGLWELMDVAAAAKADPAQPPHPWTVVVCDQTGQSGQPFPSSSTQPDAQGEHGSGAPIVNGVPCDSGAPPKLTAEKATSSMKLNTETLSDDSANKERMVSAIEELLTTLTERHAATHGGRSSRLYNDPRERIKSARQTTFRCGPRGLYFGAGYPTDPHKLLTGPRDYRNPSAYARGQHRLNLFHLQRRLGDVAARPATTADYRKHPALLFRMGLPVTLPRYETLDAYVSEVTEAIRHFKVEFIDALVRTGLHRDSDLQDLLMALISAEGHGSSAFPAHFVRRYIEQLFAIE